MRRREFITFVGSVAAAWPFSTHAQLSERIRRIGVLMGPPNDADAHARAVALQEGPQTLGWTVGRNIQFSDLMSCPGPGDGGICPL
jgi:putative tryptophan/tyrosine transport system substrate-binding protein